MQIAILCGGEGKRIKELFPNTPKGLIKINSRPFMSYIFDSLIQNGINKVVMCTGKGHEDYFSYFNNKYKNLEISYSQDPKELKLGTGGAILNACSLLENTFFVQYGDSLLNVNYEMVLDSHKESKKPMTMTVLPIELSSENPNVFFDKMSIHQYTLQLNCTSFLSMHYIFLIHLHIQKLLHQLLESHFCE